MIAVVLDCNVLLQAMLRDDSPAFACLMEIERCTMRIQVSDDVLAEYQDVLNRETLRKKFPILTPEFVKERLQKFLVNTDFIEHVPGDFEYPRDPNDESYVNLAIPTEARYIVTRDQDLLSLMQHLIFTHNYPDITICDPIIFLKILKALC